jgi:hypothetical protein
MKRYKIEPQERTKDSNAANQTQCNIEDYSTTHYSPNAKATINQKTERENKSRGQKSNTGDYSTTHFSPQTVLD